jgi:hypothetical protein
MAEKAAAGCVLLTGVIRVVVRRVELKFGKRTSAIDGDSVNQYPVQWNLRSTKREGGIASHFTLLSSAPIPTRFLYSTLLVFSATSIRAEYHT